MTHFFFYQNVLRKDYNIFFSSKQKFSKIIKDLDTKIFTNYHFKTESLDKNLKLFLKRNKIKLKSFDNLDRNATGKSLNNNYINFFTSKNLKLIEKKENYLFKKFKYKKISKIK